MQRCPRVKRGKLGGADIARGKETGDGDGDGQITEAGSMRDVIVTDGPTDSAALLNLSISLFPPKRDRATKIGTRETHRVELALGRDRASP